MSDESTIPHGWSMAQLRDIGSWSGGGTPSKANASFWTDGTIPWVSAKDMKRFVISDSMDRITEDAVRRSAAKLIAPGSVLFVMRSGILSHTFPVARTTVPVTVNQDLRALTPSARILPAYVAYGVRASGSDILRTMSKDGTTVASVDASMLAAFGLPLAPTTEQRRIVDAIESYFTRVDEAERLLDRAQRNLERYRASVLKAAVEGRLVPTEAELARSENRSFESASILLERVLAEGRLRWEKTKSSKMQANGRISTDNSWQMKYVEPVPPDKSGLPELPEGWCYAGPAELASHENYAIGIGPFGSNLKVSDYRTEGVPLVFVRNIRAESFCGDGTIHLSPSKALELKPHIAVGGDLLITKMGEPPGDAAIYPVGSPDAVFTADCIRLRNNPSLSRTRYLLFALRSPSCQGQIIRATKGVAQKKVSLARFKRIAIPLPPLAEQLRIVAEVDHHLSLIDATQHAVERELHRFSGLRQSILTWAFEGRLVDQDPADEPASALLDRIRAERDSTPAKPAKLRPRPKPKPSTP